MLHIRQVVYVLAVYLLVVRVNTAVIGLACDGMAIRLVMQLQEKSEPQHDRLQIDRAYLDLLLFSVP